MHCRKQQPSMASVGVSSLTSITLAPTLAAQQFRSRRSLRVQRDETQMSADGLSSVAFASDDLTFNESNFLDFGSARVSEEPATRVRACAACLLICTCHNGRYCESIQLFIQLSENNVKFVVLLRSSLLGVMERGRWGRRGDWGDWPRNHGRAGPIQLRAIQLGWALAAAAAQGAAHWAALPRARRPRCSSTTKHTAV